jgi:16S rRNA (cytidine1402-2'-O)-methyltransferase
MPGTLYVVATPIGNLTDISQRALETLRSVDLVLAEDTRVTKKLLNHYDIKLPTLSYHQHSSEKKKFEILNHLLQGKNLALVTDAGTPGISDPGNELIDFLSHKVGDTQKIKAVPLPGPSALTATLSICGFNVNRFIFVGFLPKKKRQKLFSQVKESKLALIFFDSPKRILKTLDVLIEFFGPDHRVFVVRELTKLHETHYRGSLSEVRDQLNQEGSIKGEIVVVVEGR